MPAAPEQIADGVHRVADGAVNYYLVTEGERVALVDTGWPRSWAGIEASLAEIGRRPGDVEAILLTHGHPDHLGAAERARRETSAPVLVHSKEAERVRGKHPQAHPLKLVPSLSLQLWRPHTIGFVGEATAKGFLFPSWVEEFDTFEVGVPLQAPGSPIAISTPGHTDGHVSFHLPDRGVLIAGDAIVTTDPVTGKAGPCLTHDVVNQQPDVARKSLQAIAGIDAGVIAGGHGDPWTGGAAKAAERALAAAAAV